MFRFKFLGALLICATFGISAFGQSFKEADGIGDLTAPKSISFTAFNSKYRVDAKSGKVKKSNNGEQKAFYLPLDKEENIRRVHFAAYKNDLIVFYEVDTWDASRGVIIRLNAKTNKIKWKRFIPALNIKGALENSFAYIAGVGYLAKIKLDSGGIMWKTDGFYNENYGMIDVPSAPQIERKRIVFMEDKSFAANYRRTPKKIIFDKTTGRILQ